MSKALRVRRWAAASPPAEASRLRHARAHARHVRDHEQRRGGRARTCPGRPWETLYSTTLRSASRVEFQRRRKTLIVGEKSRHFLFAAIALSIVFRTRRSEDRVVACAAQS